MILPCAGRKNHESADREKAARSSDREERPTPVAIASEYPANQRSYKNGNRPYTREEAKDARPQRFGEEASHKDIG